MKLFIPFSQHGIALDSCIILLLPTCQSLIAYELTVTIIFYIVMSASIYVLMKINIHHNAYEYC